MVGLLGYVLLRTLQVSKDDLRVYGLDANFSDGGYIWGDGTVAACPIEGFEAWAGPSLSAKGSSSPPS